LEPSSKDKNIDGQNSETILGFEDKILKSL